MNECQIIMTILKESNMKIATLAKMLNMDRRVIDRRLRQDGMTVGKLCETCRPLGYKVVIMPIEKRLPEGAYEVEK